MPSHHLGDQSVEIRHIRAIVCARQPSSTCDCIDFGLGAALHLRVEDHSFEERIEADSGLSFAEIRLDEEMRRVGGEPAYSI